VKRTSGSTPLTEVTRSIGSKQPVEGMDKQQLLLDRLRFSVDQLKPELRSGWLDIAVLFNDQQHDLRELELVYGHHTLAELQRRSLIGKSCCWSLKHTRVQPATAQLWLS